MNIAPHERKFTPHSYFSNTLRHVVAAGNSVAVVLPHQNTEKVLRTKMFKIYRDDGIKNSKDYEEKLKELVDAETITKDISLNSSIGKRYLFLKAEVDNGTVDIKKAVSIDDKLVHFLNSSTKKSKVSS